MITYDEIHQEKIERHVDSFINEKISLMKKRFPIFTENMGDNLKSMLAHKREEVQAKKAARMKKRKEKREKKKEIKIEKKAAKVARKAIKKRS